MCRTSDLSRIGPCVHAQILSSFLHFLACLFLHCCACGIRCEKIWNQDGLPFGWCAPVLLCLCLQVKAIMELR